MSGNARDHLAAPPYDPQLTDALSWFKATFEPIPLLPGNIQENRDIVAAITPTLAAAMERHDGVVSSERVAVGPRGEIELTVVEPVVRTEAARPAALVIHGGGLVLGDRFFAAGEAIGLTERYGAVAVLVEYRRAPEFPGTAPVEDCHAALTWIAEHAAELHLDPERLVVTGFSAGGGLSAGVALMARDLGGPRLAGQLLGCPMLDDRDATVSTRQYDGIGVWDRTNNRTAWSAVLGEEPRGEVSPYAAPARATDLSGLPPAFVDVGGAEVFRDEAIDYASRIWAAGGSAELHVWDGGFHGFAGFAPEAWASRASAVATDSWWRRVLRLDGAGPALVPAEEGAVALGGDAAVGTGAGAGADVGAAAAPPVAGPSAPGGEAARGGDAAPSGIA